MLPNILTYFRIVAVPIIVVAYYAPIPHAKIIAAGIFLGAALTDWLDGYIARRWSLESKLGAFLDPVADKLLVVVVLVMMVEVFHNFWITFAAMVIISREIIVSALREWFALQGAKGKVIAVSFIAKIKTSLQLIALSLMLAIPASNPWVNLGLAILAIAAIMTIVSMILYLRHAYLGQRE